MERKIVPPDHLYSESASLKERVEWILENFPRSRADDGYLFIIYVRYFEPTLSKYIEYMSVDDLKRLGKLFKSIERTRRFIQYDEKKYLPIEPVVVKRKRSAYFFRKKY